MIRLTFVLVKFKVGNFLSINERIELSMMAGSSGVEYKRTIEGTVIPTLRTSLIYGANASGKSSLIRALIYSRGFIVGMDPMKSKLSRDFKNRLNADLSFVDKQGPTGNTDSYFEYMLEIDGHIYSYGFEITTKETLISSEWLVEYSTSGERKVLFERDQVGLIIPDDCKDALKKQKIQFDSLADKESRLFLNHIGRSKTVRSELEEMTRIYRWFRNELIIRTSDSRLTGIVTNDEDIDTLFDRISRYDTGITGYDRTSTREKPMRMIKNRLEEDGFDYKKIKDGEIYLGITDSKDESRLIIINRYSDSEKGVMEDVHLVHENSLFKQYYKDESDGTKRLIQIQMMFLPGSRIYSGTSIIGEPRTIIIDEMDRSIHTKMVFELIEQFIDDPGLQKCQLITTIHESHIMNKMRTDEIWFIDKNEKGESRLYSLEEYEKDYRGKVDELYMEGRFDAVPRLRPME